MLVIDRKNGAVLSRYEFHPRLRLPDHQHRNGPHLSGGPTTAWWSACTTRTTARRLAYHKTATPLADKPLEERIKELQDKLAQPVTDAGGAIMTFKEFRDKLLKDQGIKMEASADAFKQMNLPPPNEQMITTPKADMKPLGDVLKDVVGQVNGEYTRLGDRLFVSPANKMK